MLVLLPGGTFRMGASDGDSINRADEKPAHDVKLAPFFISKYELTQGQWKRLTGKNPSLFKPGYRHPGRREVVTLTNPVERVAWDDCRKRLARVGLLLPTEAQWEYAARARTRTPYWIERSRLKEAGNLADLPLKGEMKTFRVENWRDGYLTHAPVGRFLPNGFGLYDVIGNVGEWCRDPFVPEAYRLLPKQPEGWRAYSKEQASSGADRIHRGGGWVEVAVHARSARRGHAEPLWKKSHIGVRPARRIH